MTPALLAIAPGKVDGYTVNDQVREQKIEVEIVIVTAAGVSQVIDCSSVRAVVRKLFDVTQLIDIVSTVYGVVKAWAPT